MLRTRPLGWEQGDDAEGNTRIQTQGDESWLDLLARKDFRLFCLAFFYKLCLDAFSIGEKKKNQTGVFVFFTSLQVACFIYNEQ